MILRLRYYQLYLRLAAYALPWLAFELAWRLWMFLWRVLGYTAIFNPAGHFGLLVLVSFVWAIMAEHYELISVDELFRENTGIKAAAHACGGTSAILLAAFFFSRNVVFPRGLFAIGMVVLLFLALILKSFFRIYVRIQRDGGRPVRLLIVGADHFAQRAALRLQNMRICPCRIVGYVRLPGQELAVTDNALFELEHLGELCAENGVDEAIIAVHPAQFPDIPKVLHALEHLSVPVRAIVDLGEGIVVRQKLFQLGRMQMLDLTSTPAESLDYTLLKRSFDIAFSSIILVLIAPLLAAIAICVRLTSRGPTFFAQERVGLNGKLFRMYKFRTMNVLPASQSDTVWTTKHDPRCTAIGSFLRKTSLDEIPQFFNVLKGDMSVVGPRPERPHFVQKFLNDVYRYNNRHWLKVGITGWAQVNGWRGDTSIQKRLEFDIYYLQNWSLTLDLKIIFLTLFKGLVSRNAY